jgi:Tfp pilus assembly protein PilZ
MLPDNLGPFSVPCEVVRIQWIATKNRSKGYAVKFILDDENTRKILNSLLIYIKNNQIITVCKRLQEEIFKRPPTI